MSSHASVDSRSSYWTARYKCPDWPNGIDVGRFSGLPEGASLSEASRSADEDLVRAILETCSVFRLMTPFRVLEIGCGTGGLAIQLAESLFSSDFYYIGYDVSATAVAQAIRKWESSGSKATLIFKVGDIPAIVHNANDTRHDDLSEKGFDLLLVREVYYLLSDSERQELTKLADRVLRPGGFVYIADILLTSKDEGACSLLREHLYNRHKSAGSPLRLVEPSELKVKEWVESCFGTRFRAVSTDIDDTSICRTYESALKGEITNEATKLAYSKLADLARKDSRSAPSIIYAKAFLFKEPPDTERLFTERDYSFSAAQSYYGVLKKGNVYGAYKGQWNLVIGRSGRGKTSLPRALEGELPKISGLDAALICDTRYCFLSQQIDVFESLPPVENVTAFGFDMEAAEHLLERLGLPKRVLRSKNSRGLSGGEKQRVAIAQCVAAMPDTIVLDGPLKGLDKPQRLLLFEILHKTVRAVANQQDPTLICVDHDFELIYKRFDVVFEMLHEYQVAVWRR